MYNPQKVHDRFHIVKHLRSGGVGDVFVARDLASGQTVTIKVASAKRNNCLIEKEIKVYTHLGLLPGIPRLIHTYTIDEHVAFAMSYHRGQNVGTLLEQGNLSIGCSARLLSALCVVLEGVHNAGYLHCDLKPDNVIVDDALSPTIVDFDAATPVGSVRGENQRVMGTAAYLAPERLEHHRPIGSTADIYSLGCLWYECLTGYPPFDSDDKQAIIDAHRFQEPPSFASSSPHAPCANTVLSTMLAKNPGHRPQTTRELIELLEPLTRADLT